VRYTPAILLGRLVRFAARVRKPGGGSAFPGLVVNRVAPGFLAKAIGSVPDGLVVVSGSSGKSTTTKMLVAILEAHGKRVFTNPSTANIEQGLTSAVLERATVTGRIPADIAVLEMDEAHAARIAPRLHPRVVVLTNVMTDQIDRFWDSEQVLGYLEAIALRASDALVLNADDAMLMQLVERVPPSVTIEQFGVTDAVLADQPRGLGYTRTTDRRPTTGAIVSTVDGRETSIVVEGAPVTVTLPARGVHYAVDAAAALGAARSILGDHFAVGLAARTISQLEPVFARGEVTTVRGKEVEFVLVQNPASFQLNIDALDARLDQVMMAMGSDVRDPGYLWPVDLRRLQRVSTVSGSKAHELALQVAYQGIPIDRVEPDLATALDDFLALGAPTHGRKTIVFTADAMRRTRTHLGLGR
jgi:lipid II isoglutaminyl synthase (glutamine-hydrolysing)